MQASCHPKSVSTFRLTLPCALILTLGMASSAAPSTTPTKTPALVAFANAWNGVNAYSTTITIYERKGDQTQTMVFDYTFAKPSSVRTHVVAGANRGARLEWEGGSTVLVRKGSGLLSIFKKTVSLHDPLVTTIRGSTVDQLGFGAILAHAQQPGVLTENGGIVAEGATTDAVTLIPTHPASDADFTREVIEISKETHLPTRVLGYEGTTLARKIDFSNIHLVP